MIPQLHFNPIRSQKPRTNGITIITDLGNSCEQTKAYLKEYSAFIDFVRLESAALLSESIAEKIEIYKEYSIQPVISGVVFEAFYIRNQVDDFKEFAKKINCSYIEISDGLIEIKPDKKAELIKEFSKDFKVISKVGPRDNSFVFETDSWREYIEKELEAGSEYVVIQGDEAGVSLKVNGEQDVKEVLAYAIAKIAPIQKLVWEAPELQQTQWYIKNFGSSVNIASVQMQCAPIVESMRIGLHHKTFTLHIPPHVSLGVLRKMDTVYNFDWQI